MLIYYKDAGGVEYMDEVVEIHYSYYKIPELDSVPTQLINELSKWNAAYFKMENIGFYYDARHRELRIPRGYPIELIKHHFKDRRIIRIDDNMNIPVQYDAHLTTPPKDYIQENTLAFMLSKGGHDTFYDTQLYVDLNTGSGKTYISIATTMFLRTKALIVSPNIGKVTKQWMDTISNFTTLRRDEYLHVKGSKICSDIIEGKYKDVKIFIIQRSTILSFIKKYDNNWEMLRVLVEAMDVSIKIIDEAHMDFNTIVNVDCFTDLKKTFYMSASPSRSDMREKEIYKLLFKRVKHYGSQMQTVDKNHITVLILEFKSEPTVKQVKSLKTRYGPSLSKYGDYLLDPKGARDDFLNSYYYALYLLLRFRRDGGKILVLGITIRFCEELEKITNRIFPYLTTGLYIGNDKKLKKKSLNNDIIFSTIKSMGTGSEIQNHQFTINTITYSSDILANQIPGRLRKQDRKAIYCELVNVAHEVALKHYIRRQKFLSQKGKNGKILKKLITDSDYDELDKFFSDDMAYDENGNLVKCKDESEIVLKRRNEND